MYFYNCVSLKVPLFATKALTELDCVHTFCHYSGKNKTDTASLSSTYFFWKTESKTVLNLKDFLNGVLQINMQLT